jgi:hypothetical protein
MHCKHIQMFHLFNLKIVMVIQAHMKIFEQYSTFLHLTSKIPNIMSKVDKKDLGNEIGHIESSSPNCKIHISCHKLSPPFKTLILILHEVPTTTKPIAWH